MSESRTKEPSEKSCKNENEKLAKDLHWLKLVDFKVQDGEKRKNGKWLVFKRKSLRMTEMLSIS